MLCASNKFRCKGAIETVSKGKRTLLFHGTQVRQPVQKKARDVFILFRLKAAGAVNKCTMAS